MVAGTRRDSGVFATAVSVAALQQQVEERIGRLESRLDSQFSQLLDTIRASQQPPLAAVPPPTPAQAPPPPPPAQPAVASATPSAGLTSTAGESSSLSLSRCFPWVSQDLIELVANDQLKPELLTKLRNPESRVSREPSRPSAFILSDGQLKIAEDTAEGRTSTFIKAIPNVAALAQVWLAYIDIRVRHTKNIELNSALLAHLEHLLEFDSTYTWRAVAEYHLAVCRKRFGTGVVAEWATTDSEAHSRILVSSFRPAPFAPSSSRSDSASGSRQPAPSLRIGRSQRSAANPSTGDPICLQPDSELLLPQQHLHQKGALTMVNSPSHSDDHARLQPAPLPTAPSTWLAPPPTAPNLRPAPPPIAPSPLSAPLIPAPSPQPAPLQTAPSTQTLPPTIAPLPQPAPLQLAPSPPPAPPTTAPSPQPAPLQLAPSPPPAPPTTAPSPQPAPLTIALGPLDLLAPDGIADMSPASASSSIIPLLTGLPPPPRPNTVCRQPIFDVADVPATIGSLQLHLWSHFLDLYPDQAFASQLRGALRHCVKLGYDGPLRSSARLEVANLPMDADDTFHLRREIDARLREGRLHHVVDPDGIQLVCSPVGVVPKPHSDKRRTIYHLSHPRKPGSRLPSVNDGIHPSFVTIRYESLDAIMDFIREHPSASLWKADLEDAFRHVIVAKSDARLMGIHFDGQYYQECALAFGGRSSPFLFNLFAEFLHWLASFVLQSVSPSPSAHSEVSHYLDDFFGASDPAANDATPVQALSIAASALGFKLSRQKTVWQTTKLEILGIELDSVAQTAAITPQRSQRIIQLCSRIVNRGRASLLELQQVAGHLQFVTRVAPHGRAFLRRIYDAVKAHHSAPHGRRISKATQSELLWWINTLQSWDGVSLLQPSPLLIEHIWTDASKRSIGGHWGSMDHPSAAFTKELSRRHRAKDIRFLEALAVLEALRLFSPSWPGPRRVVIHVDNENVEYGLRKGSIRDPQTQALFREIFSLCLQRHIDLVPFRVSSEANILADALSCRRFSFIQQQASDLSNQAALLLWNGLAPSTRARSTAVCSDFTSFATATLHIANPFPASPTMLIEWVAHHHMAEKSVNTLKRDLSVLKSWHVDLGLSTSAFDSERLERVVRGYKRVVGQPLPSAKLPITLPLLRQLARALYTACPSPHDRRMYKAAFCVAFACFLRSGELTWEAQGPNVLTVAAVSFAEDFSFATITLPASKTDPFRHSVALTAPAVPLSTCAVTALRIICAGRSPIDPLFTLEGRQPFTRSSFVSMLRRCLDVCGVPSGSYSGHSFRRGAATWAAANGVDADTIRGLGRWRSDCFRRYVDKSAAERATTSKAALYVNSSAPLHLDAVAWRNF
ncbi:uncharacterized protein MEPE_04890 [Melanopsichium pennsylvanicum]|uniref:Reverse transcriptase domain-containing protein n=1 Tax=Melanopsichium pennsylvanicum TaxID=63383 RepID=A0AAJ4XQN6_9BASI|nr:uncharacterized protein MEPE_04890 [Melanopsichium pennsylvanicum]